MADYTRQANKWYCSARWQRIRKSQLAKHPYCQCPYHKGKDTSAIATVVDHRIPHRGDPKLFWNGELQSMTKQCHDSAKQAYERSGYWKGADKQGNPIDTNHHWNQ